jgi:indole-3-glycerol phosphate synthase
MILDEIVLANKKSLEAQKLLWTLADMKKMAISAPAPVSFARAIFGEGIKLIAEVKKASPSRGTISGDADPVSVAMTYSRSGAAAISVLTESVHFQGSLNNLSRIRYALMGDGIPLLRKDFLTDSYQVYESRVNGADAILLITAILSPDVLKEMLDVSHALGMECLVEVHNEKEIETALATGARIIGINNRDLTTFTVDIETTSRLRPLIPGDRIVVSESGIKERRDIEKLQQLGINAVLIGEALMTAPDIAAKIKELF